MQNVQNALVSSNTLGNTYQQQITQILATINGAIGIQGDGLFSISSITAQIATLQTALNNTPESNTDARQVLSAQIALLQEMHTVQTALEQNQNDAAAAMNNLRTLQSQVSTTLTDPTKVAEQLTLIQQQYDAMPDTPANAEFRAALSAQIAVLNQIQGIQNALQTSNNNLTYKEQQVGALVGLITASNLDFDPANPATVTSTINLLQNQMNNTSDTAVKEALQVQIGILQEVQTVSAQLQVIASQKDTQSQAIANTISTLTSVSSSIKVDPNNVSSIESSLANLQNRLSNTQDQAIKNLINSQIEILTQLKSLAQSTIDLTQEKTGLLGRIAELSNQLLASTSNYVYYGILGAAIAVVLGGFAHVTGLIPAIQSTFFSRQNDFNPEGMGL